MEENVYLLLQQALPHLKLSLVIITVRFSLIQCSKRCSSPKASLYAFKQILQFIKMSYIYNSWYLHC